MGVSTIAYKLQAGQILRSRAIISTDAATTAQVLEIPAKTQVLKVWVQIVTALAGGSPSLDIGDGDNTDGWVDTTEITEGTTGTYFGAAEYSTTGKYYATADTIDAVVATGLTSGKAYVFAWVLPVGDILD
jgi:hypothetical protein